MFGRITTLPVSNTSLHEYIVERSDAPTDKGCWDFRFVVLGKSDFPVDMLRHDQCWPVSTEDAVAMLGDSLNRHYRAREVVLVSRQPRKLWLPTFERWRSFGWVVKSTAWE